NPPCGPRKSPVRRTRGAWVSRRFWEHRSAATLQQWRHRTKTVAPSSYSAELELVLSEGSTSSVAAVLVLRWLTSCKRTVIRNRGEAMDRARMTIPFVALIAMGVIASGARAPTDSKQSGQNSQAGPVSGAHGGKEAPWRGYQRVLKRYFGPNFDEKQARNEKYLCRFLNKYQVHVLLATLPDPSDSHLADSFDNYLASIQLALANDHYLIDEYWLPEVVRRKEAAKAILAEQPHALVLTPIGKPVGSMSSVLAKAKEPDLLDQPGIMLFRRKLP